jgi:dihydrofolate reductase
MLRATSEFGPGEWVNVMRRLTSIVAVNRDGVIGCGNTLPWRLKSDLRFFRETTTGNVVLMGRKTFDSLGRKCLPKRYNVVVSHSFNLFPETETCRGATGIGEALHRASKAPKSCKELFVIGGASMYEQFSPFVERYLITLVDKTVSKGDTFFREDFLGDPDAWNINQLNRVEAGPDDEVSFSIYEVIAKDPGKFRKRRAHEEEVIHSRVLGRKHMKATVREATEKRIVHAQTSCML